MVAHHTVLRDAFTVGAWLIALIAVSALLQFVPAETRFLVAGLIGGAYIGYQWRRLRYR